MKRVYFVCVGNSCRSQMAEGFARTLGEGILEVRSGGTRPAHAVSRKAREVMEEKGIDISGQEPEGLDLDWAGSSDYLIAMGCDVEAGCPAGLYERMVDWDLADPIGEPLEVFREVRDEIEARVRRLVELAMEEQTVTGSQD